jgi:hypothetical protein
MWLRTRTCRYLVMIYGCDFKLLILWLVLVLVTIRVFAQWCFVLMTLSTPPLANHENPKSTLGQNPSLKPHCPLWPLCAILELWHVLQNFPKHFKTTQREKCAEFQGTQLCCWVALLVWSVGGWKWQNKTLVYCSQAPRFWADWHDVPARFLEQNPY